MDSLLNPCLRTERMTLQHSLRKEWLYGNDSLASFRPKCVSTEWRNLYDRVGTILEKVKCVVVHNRLTQKAVRNERLITPFVRFLDYARNDTFASLSEWTK